MNIPVIRGNVGDPYVRDLVVYPMLASPLSSNHRVDSRACQDDQEDGILGVWVVDHKDK